MSENISKKQSVKEFLLEKFRSVNKNGFVWYELYKNNFKRHSFDQAVSELVKEHKIIKIINGLFYIKKRKTFDIEDVANAIILKNHFNGVTANKNNIWLAAIPKTRKYTVEGQILTFKATSPKKISPAQSKDNIYYAYKHATNNQRNERYTPENAVKILIPHIEQLHKKLGRNITIWCPADTKESEYYKVLSKLPYAKVITTHINEGIDFLTYAPDFEFDVIATNPPFQNKAAWLKKALEYNISFALFLPLNWLNDRTPSMLFGKKQMQILIPDLRTNFGNATKKQVPFKTVYICYNLLERDIVNCYL